MRTVVWFRGKDLRVADHAPLREAARGGEVIPLFVLDPYFFAPERARELPHRMQFLLDALAELERSLAARGSRLIVVAGKSVDVVPRLAARWKADRVVAHRWIEPFARERDRRIGEAVRLELYEGETLVPPGTLRSGTGRPYALYTPFARAARRAVAAETPIGSPLAAPRRLPPVPRDVKARVAAIPRCEDLGIARNPAVVRGGEHAARARLRAFVKRARSYATARDRMDREGTSRLSADLKFGTLSVRSVWHAVDNAKFRDELLWRELAYHTLWDRPEVLERPCRAEFEDFPWRDDARAWGAWVDGKTGYPVVDAAARQLLGEGYVHNRARMIAASFLTKHLVIDYRRGEAHYMKWLVDGDWANNNLGWQWSAGSGCDAQPYFRIFNPVTQGERFDPDGAYVRRWVPELARVPARYIHAPWTAPASVLREAGVVLGETYPRPIVEHRFARERFLAVAHAHLRR